MAIIPGEPFIIVEVNYTGLVPRSLVLESVKAPVNESTAVLKSTPLTNPTCKYNYSL